MKPLITVLFILFSFLIFSQNTVEVSISKISSFSTYQKDSIHTMLKNTDLLPYNEIYKPINLKFVINKKTKKVHRYKNDLLVDIIPITKIEFKDSTYTITVVEKREEGWSHYENQMIDCYLVLDIRKNPTDKKQPTFVYWWNWDIYLNDQHTDWCNGNVSDYVTIK
jgi:hypothetical protein